MRGVAVDGLDKVEGPGVCQQGRGCWEIAPAVGPLVGGINYRWSRAHK